MCDQSRQRPSAQRTFAHAMFGVMLAFLVILAGCSPAPAASPTAPAAADATSAPNATEPTAATAAEPTAAPAADATKITWLLWGDNAGGDQNYLDELELFTAAHPDIQVELITVPWNDFIPKIQTMIAAGTPPDVVSIQNEGEFVSKGFVDPLEPYMEADADFDINNFLPGSATPAYDGKIYGFNHDTAFWLLYYNKDIFDAAGEPYPPAEGYTLDEFIDVACRLSDPENSKWGMNNLNWLMSFFVRQQGLEFIEVGEGAPQFRIDDPAAIEIYQKVGDFINKDNCQPNTDQTAALGGANPFITGQTAMVFDGNWGFGWMKENAKFNWAVAPLVGRAQPNVGMKVGIVSTSENKEAAWTFLKWLTYEPEASRFRAERGIGQPAITDEEANNIFLTSDVAPEGLDNVLKVLADPANAMVEPSVPGQAAANNIINPAGDEIMQGLSAAADVLPPAVEQANAILQEEWDRATGGQ